MFTGLPFRHKNGDFSAISVTERNYAAPISKVERHTSDRFSECHPMVQCERVIGPYQQ